MYKIAICDDMPDDSAAVREIVLDTLGTDAAVETFASGPDMQAAFNLRPFDIVIMDVMLGSENGIETLKKVCAQNSCVQVIFVSSVDAYMYESYAVPHLWYIKKEDISTLLPNALRRAADALARLESERLEVFQNGVYTLVRAADVLYMEQQGRKTCITTRDGVLTPYGKIADRLGTCSSFLQIHKSYAINTAEAVNFTRTEVHMSNGVVLPIGRKYYPEIRTWLASRGREL